jgi:hypothetical protein
MPAPPTRRFRVPFVGHFEASSIHDPVPATVAGKWVGGIPHMAHLSVSAHQKVTCEHGSNNHASPARDYREALQRSSIAPQMASRETDSRDQDGVGGEWSERAGVARQISQDGPCAMSGGYPSSVPPSWRFSIYLSYLPSAVCDDVATHHFLDAWSAHLEDLRKRQRLYLHPEVMPRPQRILLATVPSAREGVCRTPSGVSLLLLGRC